MSLNEHFSPTHKGSDIIKWFKRFSNQCFISSTPSEGLQQEIDCVSVYLTDYSSKVSVFLVITC